MFPRIWTGLKLTFWVSLAVFYIVVSVHEDEWREEIEKKEGIQCKLKSQTH